MNETQAQNIHKNPLNKLARDVQLHLQHQYGNYQSSEWTLQFYLKKIYFFCTNFCSKFFIYCQLYGNAYHVKHFHVYIYELSKRSSLAYSFSNLRQFWPPIICYGNQYFNSIFLPYYEIRKVLRKFCMNISSHDLG